MKFPCLRLFHPPVGVAPARGRGLKLAAFRFLSNSRLVAPARGRGLKYFYTFRRAALGKSPPQGGVD